MVFWCPSLITIYRVDYQEAFQINTDKFVYQLAVKLEYLCYKLHAHTNLFNRKRKHSSGNYNLSSTLTLKAWVWRVLKKNLWWVMTKSNIPQTSAKKMFGVWLFIPWWTLSAGAMSPLTVKGWSSSCSHPNLVPHDYSQFHSWWFFTETDGSSQMPKYRGERS